MNDRIKQLAEQAGLKWKVQPPHYTNTNNPIDFPVSANRDSEKFAELIVKKVLDEVAFRAFVSGDTAWSDDADRHWVELEFGFGRLAKLKKK